MIRLVTTGASFDTGGVFTSSLKNVSTFSTAFQFRLTSPAGISDGTAVGADGFVFVVRRDANNTLGGSGSGLGYSGIGQSIGVEFDTFNNGSSDQNSSNHVGLDLLGSVVSTAGASVSPDFDNGALWTAWIDYDGTTLEVRASPSSTRPNAFILSSSLNLTGTIGGSTAYVGFTAATGGASENHDLINWTFSDHYVSGGVTPGSAVPEPADAALIAGAAAIVGTRFIRRRVPRVGAPA